LQHREIGGIGLHDVRLEARQHFVQLRLRGVQEDRYTLHVRGGCRSGDSRFR